MSIISRIEEASRYTTSTDGRQIFSDAGRTRSLDRINAVMLHQMGFHRSSAHDQFDRVIAHYAVLQNGDILQLRHLDAMLNCSLGGTCIHVEFEGCYINDAGRRIILPLQRRNPGPEVPPACQIEAGRRLIRHIKRKEPGVVSIFAHRQVSQLSRQNDPGPHIWFNVGDWAVREFGFSTDPPARAGETGLSIPATWHDERFRIHLPGEGHSSGWTAREEQEILH